MFEILLRPHRVQMKVELILHIIHIAETSIIEAVIYGLSRGRNMGVGGDERSGIFVNELLKDRTTWILG